MANPRVYDKAKWQSSEGPAAFFAWIVQRGLAGDGIAPDDVRAATRSARAAADLLARYGGTLASDLLSEEGRRFTSSFYGSAEHSADLAATRGKPAALAKRLDARLERWRGAATKSAAKPADALEARLARLRARAKKGKAGVEVEHLLAFAQLGDAPAAAPLRELATQYKWPRAARGYVPLGAWVDAITIYLELDEDALVSAVAKKKLAVEIALGVLEELSSAEAAAATLRIAVNADKAKKAVIAGKALNVLGTLLGKTEASNALAREARELAHRLLARKLSPEQIVACYTVLMSVGDAVSLALIESNPPLRGAWAGAEKYTAKKLRGRLRRPR